MVVKTEREEGRTTSKRMRRRIEKHKIMLSVSRIVKEENRLPCNSEANFMYKKKRGNGKFRSARKLTWYLLGTPGPLNKVSGSLLRQDELR